jgi:hypothetical protein
MANRCHALTQDPVPPTAQLFQSALVQRIVVGSVEQRVAGALVYEYVFSGAKLAVDSVSAK